MIGNFRKRNGHSLSGIDSNYGGSMYMPEGSDGMNILDARTGTDTYMERAVEEIERNSLVGAATLVLSNEMLV